MILEKIELECKKRNITISALEKELKLGNSTIKGWGKSSPKVSNLKKVADYFDVTVDELLGGEK